MSDHLNEKLRGACEQYAILSNQFDLLMAKVDAMEAAPTQKNSEAGKSSTLEAAESLREACKGLAKTIRGCLKDLGVDVDKEDAVRSGTPTETDEDQARVSVRHAGDQAIRDGGSNSRPSRIRRPSVQVTGPEWVVSVRHARDQAIRDGGSNSRPSRIRRPSVLVTGPEWV